MSRREAPRKDKYADVINELPDSGTYFESCVDILTSGRTPK
jgi:hypothetical protein